METIYFKKSGNPLKLKFAVKNELLGVEYSIKLLSEGRKNLSLIFQGNNYKKREQIHFLRSPVNYNDGRILSINADYTGFESNINKKYLMAFEIYQGENLLKNIELKGSLSSLEKNLSLLFQLEMK